MYVTYLGGGGGGGTDDFWNKNHNDLHEFLEVVNTYYVTNMFTHIDYIKGQFRLQNKILSTL